MTKPVQVLQIVFVLGILAAFTLSALLYLPPVSEMFPANLEEGDSDESDVQNRTETSGMSSGVYSKATINDSKVTQGGYGLLGQNLTSPWFHEVSKASGLVGTQVEERRNHFTESSTIYGVYASDVDDDQFPELLSTGHSGVYFFQNHEGNYSIEQRFPEFDNVASAHFLDYDKDGDDDLYLMSDESSVFLRNQDGEFVTEEVGLEISYESVRGAASADFTGNGCLDLFVIQAANWEENRPEGYNDRNVTIEEDSGNENRLFAGDCQEFEGVTRDAGIQGGAWSLATSFVDFTNDGWPDIHVANDFNDDVLYINDRDGTFTRKVLPSFTNRNGMSSEVADITGNGYLDIFVTNIYYDEFAGPSDIRYGGRIEGNNLLLNRGNATFEDRAEEYGVRKGGWGWAALMEDFNNDGLTDLYHSEAGSGFGKSYPNIWRGESDEFQRLNASDVGFDESNEVGVASLDYDRDGSMDILTVNITQTLFLYENRHGGRSLQIKLQDSDALEVGSRIQIDTGEEHRVGVVDSGSDYRSQSSKLVHFGTGNETEANVTVTWPDGHQTTFNDTSTEQRLVVSRDGVERTIEFED